ncbi:MAG: VCBS repeat-containing protein [Bacteroidota bacterium]
MKHPEEKTLQLYALNAAEVKDKRAEIETHLKECAGCAALHQEISEYYDEVERLQEEQSEEGTQALTLRRMILRVPPLDRYGPLSPIPRTVPARVVLFVIRHPVVSSTSLVAVLLAGLLFLYPKKVVTDLNPAYARAKEEFLISYNKQGEELWRKRVGTNFDEKSYPPWIDQNPERGLAVKDVDADGTKEVLSIFGWASGHVPLGNAVVCYSADGSERWRYEFHRDITLGKVKYSDDYEFYLMAADDYDRDGKLDVILAATHVPWFPNAIVRLNANDGAFISEYWHNGMLPQFAEMDLDGDGVKELLFAGQNNRLEKACLAVFDPRRIQGHGPAPKEYVPQGVDRGTEKYYLLFPSTDLKSLRVDITNVAVGLAVKENGLVECIVNEQTNTGDLYYYFDSRLRCVEARPSDLFTASHRKLEAEGKVSKKLDKKYLEELRQGVRYWDGEKFVSEPRVNKRYKEMAQVNPMR